MGRAAVRVELAPGVVQAQSLSSYAGTARFAYNWALNQSREHYESVIKPAREAGEKARGLSGFDMINRWNAQKAEIAPWWAQISAQAPTQAILNAERAYANFFANLKKGKSGKRAGYPRFKAKGRCRDSFRLVGPFNLSENRLRLPRLGWIKVKEDTQDRLTDCRITSATISRRAERWHISFAIERAVEPAATPAINPDSVLGIDLGLNIFAVLSDGRHIESPKPLAQSLTLLQSLDKALARKRNVRDRVKTARARKRARQRLIRTGARHNPSKAERLVRTERKLARETKLTLQEASIPGAAIPVALPKRSVEQKSGRQVRLELQRARLHARIADQRAYFLHQTTTQIVRRAKRYNQALVVEDLAVANLLRNKQLARHIADAGWAEFLRQVEYKCLWYGVNLLVANRFYPSSQRCSHCAQLPSRRLGLSERTYRCAQCGLKVDRDLNARNLQVYGIGLSRASESVVAIERGGSVRPPIMSNQDRWPGPLSRGSTVPAAGTRKADIIPEFTEANSFHELSYYLWQSAELTG